MLLHDLTGRARGKRIALGRQVRASDRFGDLAGVLVAVLDEQGIALLHAGRDRAGQV